MTGWQRLGIAVSVLWAIGGPAWIVIQTNRDASQDFDHCTALASSVSGGYPDAVRRSQVYDSMSVDCQRTSLASTTSISRLVADDEGRKLLAFLVGGPLLLMWVLGAIVIWTCRGIAYGFKRVTRLSS